MNPHKKSIFQAANKSSSSFKRVNPEINAASIFILFPENF